MIGKVFGYLTVIEVFPQSEGQGNYSRVLVSCICGHVKRIPTANLLNSQARSCGCMRDRFEPKRKTDKYFTRRVAGVREEKVVRVCLNCDLKFDSFNSNRVCDNCKRSDKYVTY